VRRQDGVGTKLGMLRIEFCTKYMSKHDQVVCSAFSIPCESSLEEESESLAQAKQPSAQQGKCFRLDGHTGTHLAKHSVFTNVILDAKDSIVVELHTARQLIAVSEFGPLAKHSALLHTHTHRHTPTLSFDPEQCPYVDDTAHAASQACAESPQINTFTST
jgi:hypothetical protein